MKALQGNGWLAAVLLLLAAGCVAQARQEGQTPAREAAKNRGAAAVKAASASVKPVPKGNRELGLHVGEAQDRDYSGAFARAEGAGMQAVSLSFDWSGLETGPGAYKNDFPRIANAFYPARKTKVHLVLRPINTNRREFPADLKDRALDDPQVIERFCRLLDNLFAQMKDVELASLAIGNEVDAYLGSDEAQWKRFTTFFEKAAGYARTKRPGVPVGVVTQFGGLASAAGVKRAATLNEQGRSDVVMVTYYPLKGDFTVREPSVVQDDFARIVRAFPGGKPIQIVEAGYPSSAHCNSSEEKQAAFVESVFAAWDRHRDRIHAVYFSWLTDLPQSAVDGFAAYYGVKSKAFGEFLRTLGLRTHPGSGTDKPAFGALKREAKARGWHVTGSSSSGGGSNTGVNLP